MTSVVEILRQAGGTLLLFAVGWLGFRAAKKVQTPAAAMLGSLFLLGVLNLCGAKIPFCKTPVSFASKVLSGVILGLKIDRGMMSVVRRMTCPVILASFWMVASSVATGLLLYLMAGDKLSLMTCLASSSAGGIAEMSIFAMSAGADVGIVAFFQSARILVLYATLPFTATWLARHVGGDAMPQSAAAEMPVKEKFSLFEIARFAAAACAGAFALEAVHFPSGYMLGAMCGAGAMNLYTGKVVMMPRWLKNAAQICLSMTITAGLSPRTIALLMKLFVPLLISVSLIQLFSFVLALIMHKMTHWDVVTSILATCPGGLSQVVFFAEDMNANGFICGVFHAVRMVSIVLFVPPVARLLA